jgi:ankyrin repeat protein
MRAASRDNDDMIEILLRAGADLEAVDGSGLTAWHIAAQLDAVDALSAIVAAGADLDRRSLNGMNALDHAAAWGSLSVLRTLAGLGLDLNTHSEVITQGHGYPRDEGSTPLGIAAWSGQFESVVLLLELGAEVDAPSASGNTPLLMAVFSGQSPEMITVLLEAGANSEATASCVLGCSPGAEEAPDVLGWANALWRTSLVPLLESR